MASWIRSQLLPSTPFPAYYLQSSYYLGCLLTKLRENKKIQNSICNILKTLFGAQMKVKTSYALFNKIFYAFDAISLLNLQISCRYSQLYCLKIFDHEHRPKILLLWSSAQGSWLQIQRSRFWFPALIDFLRSNGSGTGATQLREYIWATWKKKQWQLRSYLIKKKAKITAVGDSPRWLRDTPLSAKVGINFADKWLLLGWYSSFMDSGHGVCLLFFWKEEHHWEACFLIMGIF
jgi:hypothetical protein